ncbi:hypothetical protein PAXRUDRAFT_827028 [Paxillus rubicundulus Ve08.2h10]|uniref:XLF-like N-terminal domain-containing protein n=1 Tax=Paxillus rubicundulus Ve08.2h10 TaxID=930991 RepID=A0A0D0DDR4_9AGAM|nr:hypothetical protein PAXRUDRAFT_827028 [Paxillus rubicundulus Ve08.2h10]
MDHFSEEHSKLLLSKEWLAKINAQTSTPYLIKFYSSSVDLSSCIMITDTKNTWAEVMSSNQLARRWRECNRRASSPLFDYDEEEAWRTRHLELLSRAHTLGGMAELSFAAVESKFGDFAFELECPAFKWRWETVFVGHKLSADILSQHLIMPLISVSHLAFSSSDVVGDLPPSDLEKAIDKVARTARGTFGTHVGNALSKPRLATTIRRMTAIFNFISDPPIIMTTSDDLGLRAPQEPTPKIIKPPEHLKSTSASTPEPNNNYDAPGHSKSGSVALSGGLSPVTQAGDSGSATESDDDGSSTHPLKAAAAKSSADQQVDIRMGSPTLSRNSFPTPRGRSQSVTKAPPSDTDSSPARPIKRPKARVPSTADDSEEERKKLVAQIRSGSAPMRGTRQPIKRGGKRF